MRWRAGVPQKRGSSDRVKFGLAVRHAAASDVEALPMWLC